MPKKFTNENPKVIASRERKAAVKQAEHDKKQKVEKKSYFLFRASLLSEI